MVASYIVHHAVISAMDLASAIGITERAARKTIAEFVGAGYVAKKQ